MVSRRELMEGAALLAGSVPFASGVLAQGVKTTSREDRLWYCQPAAKWTEALPVGNGRIGAMVFGRTSAERLQLNEDTLWAGGPYNPVNPAAHDALPQVRRLVFAGLYAEAQKLADEKLMAVPLGQMPYQNFGDLLLTVPDAQPGAPGDYERDLDLDGAIATTRFTLNGVAYRREVIASPLHQVIALRITAGRRGAIDLDIALRPAQPGVTTAQDDTIAFDGTNLPHEDILAALRVAGLVRVLPQGGTMSPRDGMLALRGANSVTILLAMATSHRDYQDVGGDPARKVRDWIAAASSVGFEQLHNQAANEHRRLYRRVALDLDAGPGAGLPTDQRILANQQADDPGLAALYFNYGRYLLICSSRPGSQPANLQGIWNDSNDPPWQSKYTININTEMNYWPAEITALPECVEPLVDMVRELAVSGERTAREMYGARGWVAHHNTDLWRASAPIDGSRWGLWPTGGAWLCTVLWRHWDYGRDQAYLQSIYPVMRGAALFFVDTLQTDPRTGFLVTNPSLSPENAHHGDLSICAGPAMDEEILRDLFDQTASAADILGIDRAFARQLRETRARLAPNTIGAEGQLQEWQEDWDAQAPDPHHRHVSHLYALFPSHQINLDQTPELARAARKSLEMRGDESTGWATAWRANLWAELREGDHAHRILRFLFGPERTYPNMFDAHPPFQIDGNFGGTATIANMLVQGRDDQILLLPALPSAWPNGSARGLRLPGTCTIDLSWYDGALTHMHLTSAIGGRKRLRWQGRTIEITLEPGVAISISGSDFH
ncbi:glycoside hydrolase family 95 protein [Qipengyuania algicida]